MEFAMNLALKAFPRIASIARRATGRILHKPDIRIAAETIGTRYGSHTVPKDFLGASSIVYSFGIGTDASFDTDVIARYGCAVHAFDPTPKSMAWVAEQAFPPNFIFHPLGLGNADVDMPFKLPEKEGNVSFSRAPGETADLKLPVRRLGTLMSELGHDDLDLLKLDIEGFEYEALADMLASGIRPRAIAVEYHHRMYHFSDAQTLASVEALRREGYRLFHVADTGREYSFIHGAQA
jgi:FkbM family methyltransferase